MFSQFDFISVSNEVEEYQFFITGNAESRRYKLRRIINHTGKAIFGDGVYKSTKLYKIWQYPIGQAYVMTILVVIQENSKFDMEILR